MMKAFVCVTSGVSNIINTWFLKTRLTVPLGIQHSHTYCRFYCPSSFINFLAQVLKSILFKINSAHAAESLPGCV